MSARAVMLADLLGEAPSVAVPVHGVCLDSRLVEAGDLYIAVGGASTHGIVHAAGALARGAVAVAVDPRESAAFEGEAALARDALLADGTPLVEVTSLAMRAPIIAARFHDHPERSLTLIGVTGTDGKTSVCRFVAAALEALGTPCGYVGTLGWGRGERLEATSLTTPDAVSLQRMLATLRDGGARAVAIEASSHALAGGRLDALRVDVAVLTNLGRDHLDYHGDLDAYRRAKASLFERPGLAAIVVNGADSLGRELAAREPAAAETGSASERSAPRGAPLRVVYRSDAEDVAMPPERREGTALVTAAETLRIGAEAVRTTPDGLAFTLVDGDERLPLQSALLGRFNVDNLLACHGVLRALGHAPAAAAAALGALRPVSGRMERFTATGRPSVVVDYAHTPQALAAALAAARAHCDGALWVVFGCGGDRDRGKRGPMGAAAEAAADHVVVTDDNPRTEPSATIIAAVLEGMRDRSRAVVIADRAAAIAHAVRAAAPADLVLVAGKGHEDYQIVGDVRLPASDRDRVNALLAEAC